MSDFDRLNRSEMKNILAGGGDTEPTTCEEFHEETGCYPTVGGHTCTGKDGNTYSAASSTGSCG